MEPVPQMSPILQPLAVRERQGGGRQDPEAFRRALQQQGSGDAEPGDGDAAAAPRRRLPRSLQKSDGIGRNDAGGTMHVDVIA